MDEKLEQVLHQVERLCEQDSEFKEALKEKLGASLSSAIRLQHERCMIKARDYYMRISDLELRGDLVKNYAKMLWYKSIFEIGQYFVQVNYQVENMMNFYLRNTDFHNKVKNMPARYCTTVEFSPQYSITIDALSYAYDKNQNLVAPEKIASLWVKIYYWAIETNQKEFFEKNRQNFNNIISIRNEMNHANSSSPKSSLMYWLKHEDNFKYGYVERIIEQMRESIILLQKED